MTREEAIEKLKKFDFVGSNEDIEFLTALEMAIQALSVPEREKGTDTFGFREATKEERESVDTYIKNISFPERENGTDIESIKEQIREEAEFAYADFEQYKIDVLGVDPETVEDELPNDDFRHGMERALEIIYIHMR